LPGIEAHERVVAPRLMEIDRGTNAKNERNPERTQGECDVLDPTGAVNYLHNLTPELSRTALRRRQSDNLTTLCRRREAVSA